MKTRYEFDFDEYADRTVGGGDCTWYNYSRPKLPNYVLEFSNKSDLESCHVVATKHPDWLPLRRWYEVEKGGADRKRLKHACKMGEYGPLFKVVYYGPSGQKKEQWIRDSAYTNINGFPKFGRMSRLEKQLMEKWQRGKVRREVKGIRTRVRLRAKEILKDRGVLNEAKAHWREYSQLDAIKHEHFIGRKDMPKSCGKYDSDPVISKLLEKIRQAGRAYRKLYLLTVLRDAKDDVCEDWSQRELCLDYSRAWYNRRVANPRLEYWPVDLAQKVINRRKKLKEEESARKSLKRRSKSEREFFALLNGGGELCRALEAEKSSGRKTSTDSQTSLERVCNAGSRLEPCMSP